MPLDQPEHLARLGQAEAEIAQIADEQQPAHIALAVAPLTARAAARGRNEADAIVKADRVSRAAGAPRQLADRQPARAPGPPAT